MAEVILTDVSKSFAADVALENVSMTVPNGSFVVLLGPTGAGKTTILRMVSGLDQPDQGAISIGGRDTAGLTPAQRDVAMVFQQYSLYPHLTVRQNLEFPLKSPILRTPRPRLIVKWVRWPKYYKSVTNSEIRPQPFPVVRCSGCLLVEHWCGTQQFI